MHDESVDVSLINERCFERLLTTIAKGFHQVVFHDALRSCVASYSITRVLVSENIADVFGTEPRISGFVNEGADTKIFEVEGLDFIHGNSPLRRQQVQRAQEGQQTQ